MYPARHREHKYADMYSDIHFGLIDIVRDRLLFRIVNYEGDTVISKTVPLLNELRHVTDRMSACEPYWGVESAASYYLFKAVMIMGIAVIFLVPMVIFGSLTRLHRHIRKRRKSHAQHKKNK